MITVSVASPTALAVTRRLRLARCPAVSGQSVDMSEYLPIAEVARDYVPVQEVRMGYIRRHGLRAAPVRLVFTIKQGL